VASSVACTSRRVPIAVALAAAALVFVLASPASSRDKADELCFGHRATITEPDSATPEGTDDPDVIITGGRKSQIDGKGGADLICAGGNKDVVKSGPGADQINGEAGGDVLYGSGGDDKVLGGPSVDHLDGGSGHDVCIGGPGGEVASAGRCDRIRGADAV
jgi:Ca2+-binding RTX toxin-like protein